MIVSKALSITTPFSDSDSFHFERSHQAVKIQAIVRGWQARKAFLPGSFYPLYEEACQETALRLMPKAKDGKPPVYLPSHLPEIVLKQSGGLKAKQMKSLDDLSKIFGRFVRFVEHS